MEICEFGNTFRIAKSISYLSDRTTLDFDLVLIDFKIINNAGNEYQRENYIKRKEDLKEFLQHKNIPLVIFSAETVHKRFSNGSFFEESAFLPLPKFTLTKNQGYTINVVAKTIFTNFLRKYQEHFYYTSYFNDFEGASIIEKPHSKNVLAFYNQNSIFLPQFKDSLLEVQVEFFEELIEVIRTINSPIEKLETPEWANKYFLFGEKSLANSIQEIKDEIINLENKLQENEKGLQKFNDKKILFTGTGDNLEIAIEEVFRELGFEILETDRNRDDLIVKYKENVAVIEIKGVNGTSGEGHSNQLEKWVTTYFDEHQIRAKGILIVNSFREKELVNRTEETFPHQMLSWATKRDHCLISSLQFLGLYYSAKALDKREELIESLFSTIGIYKGFENWKDFIEQ